MAENKNPKFNSSGCKDPTPYEAINNVTQEDAEQKKRLNEIMYVLKYIIDKCGFDLINRIALRDRKSGKEFR